MGSLYLGGPTIQEVNGKMMMGLSIYVVAVISGSLYSRFYGIRRNTPARSIELGISKALSSKSTVSAVYLLDYVLPQVAKLSKTLQSEKLDLTVISSLVEATLSSLDDAFESCCQLGA